MIVDQPQSHFIFIHHKESVYGYRNSITYKGKPLTNKEYLAYWGKWVIMGRREEFDELAKKLDPCVENGAISCVKYDRVKLEHLGFKEHVMCVYCDKREREEVWQILYGLGARLKAWFYDKETIEMWSPGGRLLENWIAAQSLTPHEAEAVRDDSRKRFSVLYENEDEIFTGWEQ
jgi:hypothetical protein